MSVIRLENLSKKFGNVTAVDNVCLTVKEGEFITLLGPSGCGKTTLLRLIAGFELPSSGNIRFDEAIVNEVPVEKRNFGMVFQSYALFPNMNVEKNIAFGLRIAGFSAEQIRERVKEVLSLVKLDGYEKRVPKQLSGGQMQRIALVRAIAPRPKILLLDEPLSALDAKIRVHLRTEIKRIQKKLSITTVYVTHDQEEALAISDRVVVMDRGRMQQSGTPVEIYNSPANTFVANFVGSANLLRVRMAAKGRCRTPNGLELAVGESQGFEEDQEAMLSIRPEFIKLVGPEAGEPENSAPGVVREVEYLGSVTRAKVQCGADSFMVDLKGEQIDSLPENHRVRIQIPPQKIKLLRIDNTLEAT
jgi:putative spermidine/putrescine transport system ATP-binding protein